MTDPSRIVVSKNGLKLEVIPGLAPQERRRGRRDRLKAHFSQINPHGVIWNSIFGGRQS